MLDIFLNSCILVTVSLERDKKYSLIFRLPFQRGTKEGDSFYHRFVCFFKFRSRRSKMSKFAISAIAAAFAFGFAGTASAAGCIGGEAVCGGTMPANVTGFSVGVSANGAFADFAEMQNVGVGGSVKSMIGSASRFTSDVTANAAKSGNEGCTGDCQNNWVGVKTNYNFEGLNVVQSESNGPGTPNSPVVNGTQAKSYTDFSHHLDAGLGKTQ